MPLHPTCFILPINTCPRFSCHDYIVVIHDRLDKRGSPCVAFSDLDLNTGRKYFSIDDQEVDEEAIVGWIDFRNEAIDPNLKRLADLEILVAGLKEHVDRIDTEKFVARVGAA